VKTRRFLHQLDLARIAPLSRDQKRARLEAIKLGRPPYSYDPMRGSILDLLNIEAGPLAPVARAPWSAIAARIGKASRSDDEEKANIGVAKALFDLATARGVTGSRHEIFPLNVGVSEKITYWSPAVIAIDGRAVVPFIDPRRERKWLTSAARRFVFSVMHERFIADPDLDGIEPCIVQFDSLEGGERKPLLHFIDGIELLSFETLDAMIQETYAIWNEVLEEREAATRRGTGTSGPLL
jgi:hypothetical protein